MIVDINYELKAVNVWQTNKNRHTHSTSKIYLPQRNLSCNIDLTIKMCFE